MTARVAALWRHPVKSHGREAVERVELAPGRGLPGDRAWAVAHDGSPAKDGTWSPSAAFSIGARVAGLQAIAARTGADGRLTLTHPDVPELTFDPATEGARLVEWVRPLTPADRAPPARLVRAADTGMTDTDYPSVSLMSLASHREVEAALGRTLSPTRWRGNVLFDGLSAWGEWDWVGRRLRLGAAEVVVRERCRRCLLTAASPTTGRRDVDMLGTLQRGWGHRDFGLYAEVVAGGAVAVGDVLEPVS
jgi:uncharacterized protein YcbX